MVYQPPEFNPKPKVMDFSHLRKPAPPTGRQMREERLLDNYERVVAQLAGSKIPTDIKHTSLGVCSVTDMRLIKAKEVSGFDDERIEEITDRLEAKIKFLKEGGDWQQFRLYKRGSRTSNMAELDEMTAAQFLFDAHKAEVQRAWLEGNTEENAHTALLRAIWAVYPDVQE